MVDPATARRWAHWFGLIFIGLSAVFLNLLPLNIMAGLPGPDLLLGFCFAWVLRRPDFVPLFLAALLFFMGDLFFLRPPGLWAGLCVIGLEFLRRRHDFARELPFLVEWAMVGAVLLAILVTYRVILAVFVISQVGLGLSLLQTTATFLAYPVLVGLSVSVLGVRRLAIGEMDQQRQRL